MMWATSEHFKDIPSKQIFKQSARALCYMTLVVRQPHFFIAWFVFFRFDIILIKLFALVLITINN